MNTNVAFTNGVIVYSDEVINSACVGTGITTIDLSTGNFFRIIGNSDSNCTITFTGGVTGGIYVIRLDWLGAFDFIASGGGNRTIKQICEASGATPDDSGDLAHMIVKGISGSSGVYILSCLVNEAYD